MKKLFIALLLLTFASCSAVDRGFVDLIMAQKYVHGTEDLPVYEGFQPIDSKNIVYDSESGRIVDASYSRVGLVANDVRDFYQETLPQLGWHKTKALEFVRDGEILRVFVTERDEITFLKFTIKPRG